MKKVLFFVPILTLCFMAYSQEKFATYNNPSIDKTFDIQISITGNENFKLYIDAISLDKIVTQGGFLIKENQYEGFISNLTEAKNKYEEWIATAKANNVTDLSKEIELKTQRVGGYFHYSDWCFDYSVTPKFLFVISKNENTDEIDYVLMVGTTKLQSSSNEYIDCDGFALIFYTPSEISDFINLITLDKIHAFKTQPQKKDLFK